MQAFDYATIQISKQIQLQNKESNSTLRKYNFNSRIEKISIVSHPKYKIFISTSSQIKKVCI